MKIIFLILIQIFGVIFGDQNGTIFERRVKRWGNYGNWNGNYGPYGGGGPPPPNNNVAIGYPTAYGLGVGPRGDGGGSNPAPKFVVRCINGGAHIGQCRLDEDAICIALGGTCINSQCCTTPFYGLMTTSTTTPQPLIIDGDAFRPRFQKSSEQEEEEDREERRRNKSEQQEEEESENVVEEVTEPVPVVEEEEKLKEIDELSRLLEFGKRNGLSTDSPIYAIFAGLFGMTAATQPPPSTQEWIPEHVIEVTQKPFSSFKTTLPPTPPSTTPPRITVTFSPPANSVETSASSEESDGEDSEDYTKRLCDDGSHAIGPCNDDGSCPLDHTCQKSSICCFNFADAAKHYLQHN